MKPKYSIGQTVKIKATGEKVKIVSNANTFNSGHRMYQVSSEFYQSYPCYESELKPYCPSRTGIRDPKTGRFVSRVNGYGFSKIYIDEDVELWTTPNSKQRNYQKIEKMDISDLESTWSRPLKEKINEIIDELGRRV